eukprot:m.13496 g.13496  ORF g.13496 m.13496 type:complete len:708 (+) comp4867_c0_seq1:81-2204(+)
MFRSVLQSCKTCKVSSRFFSNGIPAQSTVPIVNKRFDDQTMQSVLPGPVYDAYHNARMTSEAMPKEEAEEFSKKLLSWAVERGAKNFSHVFYPLRGVKPGMKHDGFIDVDYGSSLPIKPIEFDSFNASKLFMSETDGSSFPNGGLRATHTAAAFMNLDLSSPPYVRGDTLFLPCSFATYNGDALDYKTPLLRSQRAINEAGIRLAGHLGLEGVKHVYSNVGWEQEFFIIPRETYLERPDLVACERTVLGASPPRNQQNSDAYFGPINPRVKFFLEDLQQELWSLGISNSVLHNEVAPSQHEISPIFRLTNVAADENVLTMELMRELAVEHDLAVLFHEKPFAGINGSGKHGNWGLNTDTGANLYSPGKNEKEQASFVAFVAALMHGMNTYQSVLRTAVASYGNDFRLGAQEAPPAIFSMYPGLNLAAHLESIIAGGDLHGYSSARYGGKLVEFNAPELTPCYGGFEDRNRTAPIPFCGNRFELRAIGSNANISLAMVALNTLAAAGCNHISELIEDGASVRDAVAKTLEDNQRIVFTGDGYSEEWHQEAEKRGLKNLKSAVDALEVFTDKENIELFEKARVYSEKELVAVRNILEERYVNDVQIEADTMLNMVNQAILPACAEDADLFKRGGLNASKRLEKFKALESATEKLEVVMAKFQDEATPRYALETVVPAMEEVRSTHDEVERVLSKYPFPSYHSMLFNHHQ